MTMCAGRCGPIRVVASRAAIWPTCGPCWRDRRTTMANPERRRLALMGAVAVLAGLAGGGVAWWRVGRSETGPEAVAADFWALGFPTPDEGRLAMADQRGKYLLVNFW